VVTKILGRRLVRVILREVVKMRRMMLMAV
jgi:hypothetical protein